MDLETAIEIKKTMFNALDNNKKKIYIGPNKIIDIVLAYEKAVDKDTSDLEYYVKILLKEIRNMDQALKKISENLDCENPLWDLAMSAQTHIGYKETY